MQVMSPYDDGWLYVADLDVMPQLRRKTLVDFIKTARVVLCTSCRVRVGEDGRCLCR